MRRHRHHATATSSQHTHQLLPERLRQLVHDVFVSHSHDPADSMDAALESNAGGIRALKISLLGLGVTAALQAVVVAFSGSVALLADTVHNLSDALTAVPLWFAFWLGQRPRNRRYTYGYGRAEDLAGVVIVAAIAASALLAGWQSVQRLLEPQQLRNVWWVFAAGVIGAVGNELVAVYRIRIGRRIGSAALVADGLHARTDGLTSVAVALGAVGVAAGFPLADAVVGLIITVMILLVLRGAVRDIVRRLMDGVEPGLVERVHDVVARVEGVHAVDDVRLRWIGNRLRAEIEISCAAAQSLIEAHHIAGQAHHQLLHAIPRLAEAIVHTSPRSADGRDHHALLAHHRRPPPPSPP